MNNTEYLKHLIQQRLLLTKINKEADPASGISFMIRRGVAADNEDIPDDHLKRPWATIQVGTLDLASAAISALLEANEKSIVIFRKAVEKDIDAAVACLSELKHVLNSGQQRKEP